VGTWGKLRERLSQPFDASSSVFFRIAFGLCLTYWAWDYLATGLVYRRYILPKFHATYYPLDFITPLPGSGMYLVFCAIVISGLLTAVGCFYRVASLLSALLFTYVFLLDRTNYQNHYYLISLIAWWMPWLPLHQFVSVDAWRNPRIYGEQVPAWPLWLLRFHIGLPYFMGGLAKITADWLLGFPMSEMIASKHELPILGTIASGEHVGIIMAWAGMFFDLIIVGLLLWPKTRIVAYVACVLFHLTNAVVFNIHIFPWFMILATPIFFSPDWPRRVLATGRIAKDADSDLPVSNSKSLSNGFAIFLTAYAIFHILWPLRGHLYEGQTSWTERGHYFAWRMMLRGKKVVLGFAIKDEKTSVVADRPIREFLTPEQHDKLGRDPEMILHFSHFLRDQYKSETGNDAQVYAMALVSLNGRKPQLMIDPNVDLAREPRGIMNRDWVMPLTEPLLWPPWAEPPQKWRELIGLPLLKFLQTQGGADSAVSDP
jgi:vitamin K-dependent gamma-carboxylase